VPDAGKLVIFQSGGPTAVVNASLAGALKAARDSGLSRVLGARHGAEGVLASDYVDLTDLLAEQVDLLARTPGAALGSSRQRPDDAEIEQIVGMLHELGAECLLAVGGNDTAEILHRINEDASKAGGGLRVVGIPKTIDNDLPGMDHCPGYGSAARYLAMALREAAIDTEAMQRSDPIKIVEVMGRNAGWLAAAGALARESPGDAPQVIFLPERPMSVQRMLQVIDTAQRSAGWAVIIISENQRDERGGPIAGGEPTHVDAHGHPYYESAGAYLARQVQSELGIRSRYERPGSLQRTAAWAISETDAEEAELVGSEAVNRALVGETDTMVAIQRGDSEGYSISLATVPLGDVAHQERRMPDEFIADSGVDVTDRFLDYARPLIGGPLPSVFRLPR
jgi:6-phosphofructokinase